MENLTKKYRKPLKIAVMGCNVNGIGESKGADFGVCGGKDKSVIIMNGDIVKTIPNDEIMSELIKLVEKYDDK